MKKTTFAGLIMALSGLTATFAGNALAQAAPSAPIKLVVGFAAGGSNDVVARIVAKKAGEILGVPVVVQNQPGANGAIAAEAVAKATPDGQTLLIASPSMLAIAPHLVPTLPYKPLTDFVGIGGVAMNPQVIAINPDVKAQTMPEFLALSKMSDQTMAAAGTGGLSHLTIEMLKMAADGKLTVVPFKGGAPATNDTVAGHVDGIVMDLPPLKSFIEAGRLRALAVTSKDRSKFLPDVPTAIESGVRDMDAVNWFAILAPKGTPSQTADVLHAAFTKAAQDPDVVETLARAGIEPMTQKSRADFDSFLKAESKRWGDVVKRANIVLTN